MLKDNLVMLRKLNGYSQEQIAEKIDISRWQLTDSEDLNERWSFPEGCVLKPHEYLLVFCDGKDRREIEISRADGGRGAGGLLDLLLLLGRGVRPGEVVVDDCV